MLCTALHCEGAPGDPAGPGDAHHAGVQAGPPLRRAPVPGKFTLQTVRSTLLPYLGGDGTL